MTSSDSDTDSSEIASDSLIIGILHNNWDQQIVMEPLLEIFWKFPLGESAYREDREWQVGHPSTIDVRFLLGTADDDVRDMSLSSARVVMEHYVAWSD